MQRGLAGIAVAIIAVGIYITIRDRVRGYNTTYGAQLRHLTLHSRSVGRDLHPILVVPAQHSRTMLVLLHGKGSTPSSWLDQPFFDAIHALGPQAPTVLLLDGGDDSYWHNRRDGDWQSMVFDEGIPAGMSATHAKRIAIGGISMGGYGALLLGSRSGIFCAVGAHSPALWLSGADSAPGAFDDAEDYARNDIVGRPPRYRAPVWIDVGSQDPFHDAAVHYAHEIHAQLHVWPGGHEHSYWSSHMRSYFQFYARNCR